jgi:hypothetical protein
MKITLDRIPGGGGGYHEIENISCYLGKKGSNGKSNLMEKCLYLLWEI